MCVGAIIRAIKEQTGVPLRLVLRAALGSHNPTVRDAARSRRGTDSEKYGVVGGAACALLGSRRFCGAPRQDDRSPDHSPKLTGLFPRPGGVRTSTPRSWPSKRIRRSKASAQSFFVSKKSACQASAASFAGELALKDMFEGSTTCNSFLEILKLWPPSESGLARPNRWWAFLSAQLQLACLAYINHQPLAGSAV